MAIFSFIHTLFCIQACREVCGIKAELFKASAFMVEHNCLINKCFPLLFLNLYNLLSTDQLSRGKKLLQGHHYRSSAVHYIHESSVWSFCSPPACQLCIQYTFFQSISVWTLNLFSSPLNLNCPTNTLIFNPVHPHNSRS